VCRAQRAPRAATARRCPRPKHAQELATLDDEPFMDKAPAQVYAKLLEDGEYLCSERTMYCVLAAHNQVRERRAHATPPEYVKPQLVATAPSQVWLWDTTKLPGPVKGPYFTLYVIVDIFSRCIVGWQATRRESAALAQDVIKACCTQPLDQIAITRADRIEEVAAR
jgi:putative transposase